MSIIMLSELSGHYKEIVLINSDKQHFRINEICKYTDLVILHKKQLDKMVDVDINRFKKILDTDLYYTEISREK